MGDRLQKKKKQLDLYFSSFQDVFSVPHSGKNHTPYNNLRFSSDLKPYLDIPLEKKYSEKNFLSEMFDPENEISISSSDSKSQLPCIKVKKFKKSIGLPHQQEILKNERPNRMNKVKTASNWFPGLNSAIKCEEMKASKHMVRPSSSSGPCKKNSIKARPLVAQSSTDLKLDIQKTNRHHSKHNRVILKSRAKRSSKEIFENEKEEHKDSLEYEKFETDHDEQQVKNEGKRKKIWIKRVEIKSFSGKEENTEDEEFGRKANRKSASRVKKQEKRFERIQRKEKKLKNFDEENTEVKEKFKRIEKISKALPPSVSEIVDKHRSFNLNQLLNNKNPDFKGLMQEYLRRSGFPENTKIFIITGPYEYLRKILTSRGWIENTHTSSQAFDLKWTYNDQESDYKTLRPGQFFNHFSNNRELTTKSGLLKNLRHVVDYSINVDEFYPRSYDLGDNTQVQEFTKDYYRTCTFNIIKMFLGGKKVKQEILEFAMKISSKYVKDMNDKCEEIENGLNYTEDMLKRILEYCEHDEWEEDCEDHIDFKLKSRKLNDEICRLYPQNRMDGHRNVWIVKPGLNARGSGVKCMQGLSNILERGVHLQARVVQKYVETPLLINSNKFDIRQWVMVTNFDPLTVYFFDNCYLRLCQMAYTLDSLEAHIHLANYSLQKTVAKNQEETVWSLTKFNEYLKAFGRDWGEILPKIHCMVIKTLLAVKENIDSRPECFELYGFDIILDSDLVPWLMEVNLSPACTERTEWLSEMLSKMGSGIIDILFGESHKRPLYSFDLKLVKSMKYNKNKWVLLYKGEENPVGDCENLAYGQLEIVGEKLNVRRERIFDKRLELSKSALIIQRVYRGFRERIRIKRERDENVALVIQNVFRRKKAFESLEFRVKLFCCIKIQSLVRMFLAIKHGKYLRQLKFLRYIQAHVKGYYQRNEFKFAKIKRSSLVIQRVFRATLAKATAKKERKIKASILLIQKHWKKKFILKNKSACAIQKYWICRFKILNFSSTRIQKHFRGFKARQLFNNLKLINQKTVVLKNYLINIISKQKICNQKAFCASKYILQRSIQHRAFSYLCYIFYCKSATVIQKNYRRYMIQKKYKPFILAGLNLQSAVMNIQKHILGYNSRISFTQSMKNKSATIIQKIFRGYKTRKFFSYLIFLNESAKTIQRIYKGFKARRKFQMLMRIRVQENERKKRVERLKREQAMKTIFASERQHRFISPLRPVSFKLKKTLVIGSKMTKIKRKGSKKKCKKVNDSPEELKILPIIINQEWKKLKKHVAKDTIDNICN